MNNTVHNLLLETPTNPVFNMDFTTQTDKAWARSYEPIQNLVMHTMVDNGVTYATAFEPALLPLDADDSLRMACPAAPPNPRSWRLETEADCELWFHTEISNIALTAWSQYRPVTQSSHNKPPGQISVAEEVDATYTVSFGGRRSVLAIGEMKRNLIDHARWQTGGLAGAAGQLRLSRELRGYAHKYQCPQVFCFDGETLLLLQFQAASLAGIRDANCPVDCWVLPRQSSAVPLRYALYRLLAQGFRRFQAAAGGGGGGGGVAGAALTVGGCTAAYHQFHDGQPVWRSPAADAALTLVHPGGYTRSVDPDSGALRWTHPDSEESEWETVAFWGDHGVV